MTQYYPNGALVAVANREEVLVIDSNAANAPVIMYDKIAASIKREGYLVSDRLFTFKDGSLGEYKTH